MTDSEREMISSRIFPYPREKVFRAWTDPKLLAQWWGPKGFTTTFHEFDPRPGGNWFFTMHGPDGVNYPNESIFDEIVPPERIVFRHLRPLHWFQATAVFEDLNGKTRLSFRMLFENAEECEKIKSYIPQANEENFDRLDAMLKTEIQPSS